MAKVIFGHQNNMSQVTSAPIPKPTPQPIALFPGSERLSVAASTLNEIFKAMVIMIVARPMMIRGMETIGLSHVDTIDVNGSKNTIENKTRRNIETKDIKLNTYILRPNLYPRNGMMRDSIVARMTLRVKAMTGSPFNILLLYRQWSRRNGRPDTALLAGFPRTRVSSQEE
jgi:hypothetical protein